jgi:ligand-binding sensor domain-containing protein
MIITLDLSAQFPDWQFLSKTNSINVIAFEDDILWVGLNTGIFKYNTLTHTQTIFDKTNSPLPDNWISDIVIDADGNKWFVTWIDGSLIRYNDTTWSIYDSSNSPLNQSGCNITGIEIDQNNKIWIMGGCTNSGLLSFDGQNWDEYNTSNSDIPGDYINAICCAGNKLWLTTGYDLVSFDGTTWTIYDASNSNISDNTIFEIKEDGSGNIWMLHTNGVEKFDGSTFTRYDNTNTNIPNLNNTSFDIDSENNIWTSCRTYGFSPVIPGGIMKFDGNEWIRFDTTNSDNPVSEAYPLIVDNSDNIWFGSFTMGHIVKKTPTDWISINPSSTGLHNSTVIQILHGPGETNYISNPLYNSQGSALVSFNWTTWTDVPYCSNETHAMTTSPNGILYIKNRSGVKRFDGTSWSEVLNHPTLDVPYPIALNIETIGANEAEELWSSYVTRVVWEYDYIAGQYHYVAKQGLTHFNGSSWTNYDNTNSPLPEAGFTTIHFDANNRPWISSSIGLLHFIEGNWVVYNESNTGIPLYYLRTFSLDSLGNIWTTDGEYGFYRFDGIQTVHFPNPIMGQYSDCGNVTIDIDGTPWQISLFNVVHFDGINWIDFNTTNSPLPYGNIKTLSIDRYGNKWIGTQFGVMVYREGGVITSAFQTSPFLHSAITVTPNPFTDYFEIDLGKPYKNLSIHIYDLQSRLVYSSQNGETDKLRISWKNLKPGMHFYHIVSGNMPLASGKLLAM